LLDKPIGNITLIGTNEKVAWTQIADTLTIKAPVKAPNDIAVVFKID
jgi:hypothetical protein